MENPHPGRPPQLRARLLKTSPRKALSSVSNILASPTKFEPKRGQDQLPPPVVISPSKYRHKLFTEVLSLPCFHAAISNFTVLSFFNLEDFMKNVSSLALHYSFSYHLRKPPGWVPRSNCSRALAAPCLAGSTDVNRLPNARESGTHFILKNEPLKKGDNLWFGSYFSGDGMSCSAI